MNLDLALRLDPGLARTAALVASFQGLFASQPPVLVGGGAVELYTGGAYRTGDLDFVGRIPSEVSRKLAAAGFRKRGRHWLHEEAQIFIELPAAEFDRDVRIDAIRIHEWTVVLLSPEDLLVDRLAAWKFWRVPVEGINAYLLYRARGHTMDERRLEEAAGIEEVTNELESLRRFGNRERPPEEIEAWAGAER
ncbi:MAG TPA: hypothetical protein VFQ21_11760 [Gemmatimonadota bacterium]|nr:hypothetical protein [Gemmatimonadota bacterium]